MTMKTVTDIGKSIRAKLFNLARQKQLNYQMLIIRYAHERLLYRLSQSAYRERFYLKGGVLLYAIDGDQARTTVDIDFTGNRVSRDKTHIHSIFTEICQINDKSDGIRFDQDEIQVAEINENRIYKGIRLTITARMDTICQPLSVDIGFGDTVIPKASELEYPLLLPDLPSVSILAYSPETVLAEKFQAMIELAETNSRMKDFYDVYRILKSGHYDENNLQKAINATFERRLTLFVDNHSLFSEGFAKDAERQQMWSAFLRKSVTHHDETIASFEDVMQYIHHVLYPYWLNRKEV